MSNVSEPPRNEPQDVRLRKYEALYAYATETYSKEVDRLNAVEQKAAQYLSILAVLLGLNTAGFADFIRVWNACTGAPAVFKWAFMLLTLANLLAFCSFLRVIVLMKVPERRADEEMPTFFFSQTYTSVLFSMSKRFLAAVRALRRRVDVKVKYARIGIAILLAAILIAVVCGCTYTILKTREVSMFDPKEPKENQSSADEDWSLPDTALEAPDFIELERGADEEGTIRKG